MPVFTVGFCGVRVVSVVVFCIVFVVLFVFVMCLVYPMLPISLDFPSFIAPSVFCNVYFLKVVIDKYFLWMYHTIN